MKKIICLASILILNGCSPYKPYTGGDDIKEVMEKHLLDMKKQLGIHEARNSYDGDFEKLPKDIAISFLNKNYIYKSHDDEENLKLQKKATEISAKDLFRKLKEAAYEMHKLNEGTTNCVFDKEGIMSPMITFNLSEGGKVKWLRSPLPIKYNKLNFNASGEEGSKAVAVNSSSLVKIGESSYKLQCGIYLKSTDNVKKVGSALYSLGINHGKI